jgi:hypothetical protein
MKSGAYLRARKLDEEHTEIRVVADDVCLTEPKRLETEQVLSVLMRCCGVTNLAGFGNFTKNLEAGEPAELDCYYLDGVMKEWGLRTIES